MRIADAPLALDTIVFARGLATPAGVTPSLTGIDLDILPGEIFAIVGRAESGTATLLEALVGLQVVSADQFMVCGTDPRQFPLAVKQRIGVAPRRVAVERMISVEETLRMFAGFYQRADPDAILGRLGLAAVRTRPVDTLPPDLTQLLSLALALLNDPVVLFADEPTRDLDPEGSRLVWDLLRERRERGRTSVITTNHLEDVARLSDRVAILHHGRLIAADTPAQLMAQSRTPVRVTFELSKPDVPLDAVAELEGVIDAYLDRSMYVMVTRDGPATLRAAMRVLEGLAIRPVTLGMRQQTLEDVFLEMTSRVA